MYRLGIRETLRVRHYLVGDYGPETVPHVHELRVEWILDCPDADEPELDAGVMTRAFRAARGELEGSLLNDLEFFEDRQPSAARIAEYLSERLLESLYDETKTKTLTREEIRVWESETAWGAFVDENPTQRAKKSRAAKSAAPGKRPSATPKRRAQGTRSR